MRASLIALAFASSIAAAAPSAPAFALAPAAVTAAAPKAQPWTGRCYFMRGLLGGALGYSLGMDTLAAKTTAMGCKGYVKPHWRWQEFVATAIANYKIDHLPVIIGGHSVGADAVTSVVQKLKAAGVPVAIAFYYDPTSLVQCTPGNVGRAIEFRNTALFQLGQGFMTLCPDFRGSSQIYAKSIAHVALDDDPVMHASSLCEIRNAIAKSPINLCPVVGWTSSLPVVSGLISIVPAITAPSSSSSRAPAPASSDRLTRQEPGG